MEPVEIAGDEAGEQDLERPTAHLEGLPGS